MQEIRLVWAGEGLEFEGQLEGIRTPIDGDGRAGLSPMNMLLEAVAACSAIDVVDILKKGRQEPRGLRVMARGERRADPPRRYTSFEFEFEIDGDVDLKKAERAVQLSFDTYCSVYHTLRKDIDLEWRVRVSPDPSP